MDKNQKFYQALEDNNILLVEDMLKNGFDKDVTYPGENTPLHICAFYGNIEIAKILIKSGATLNQKNEDGLLPEEVALLRGHREIQELMKGSREFQEERGLYKAVLWPVLIPNYVANALSDGIEAIYDYIIEKVIHKKSRSINQEFLPKEDNNKNIVKKTVKEKVPKLKQELILKSKRQNKAEEIKLAM